MRVTEKYVFFVKTNECFSNWHPAKFEHLGIKFSNSEQAMMYAKAKLFKDEEAMKKILKTTNPGEIKNLGREVHNYQDKVWQDSRQQLVTDILFSKFKQNPKMKKELLETGKRTLVEAAHYDKIWGVGLNENDYEILDENKWKGQNLLGKCLMSVRERLLLEDTIRVQKKWTYKRKRL